MQRRRFLTLFGTVSSAALLPGTFGRALAETSSPARPGYGRGIMIDSRGSPGTNIDMVETAVTDAAIDDVRASGLTAINLSVGGPTSYDGIGGAFETALRALQGFGQVNRMARSSHFYVDKKAVKMTYWPGMLEAGSA